MTEIVEGSSAPSISLPADNGEMMSTEDLIGKQVVLYFYPKDDTPGCTKEAIAFTAFLDAFSKQNTIIIGVSPDNIVKHGKFKAKHDLGITLLADEEQELANAYGVWVEKNMYGRKYMGIERSTFLIDANGKIAKIWRKVKVPGHVEAVLEEATALNG